MENITLPLAVLAEVTGQPLDTLKGYFIDTEKTTPDSDPVFVEGEAAIAKAVEIIKAEQDRFLKLGARKKGESFETEFRTEFGFNDPAQGMALVKKFAAKEKEAFAKLEAEMKAAKALAEELRQQVEKGQKLEGPDLEKFVVNTPVFIERTAALEREIAAREAKLAKTVAEFERRELDKKLRSKLMDALNEYNPAIAGSKERQEAQKSLFVDQLMNEADWREVEGQILPFEKGKNSQATNKAQRFVDLNGFVLDKAAMFYDRNAADPSKSAPGFGAGPGKSHIPDFRGKNQEEVLQIIGTFYGKPHYEEIKQAGMAFLGISD